MLHAPRHTATLPGSWPGPPPVVDSTQPPAPLLLLLRLLIPQVLKLSYNKLEEISSSAFSGLTSLLRLHLDHNLLRHLHPRALLQLPSLRLLRLQGNRLHQLHPRSLCTLSLLNTYDYATLRQVPIKRPMRSCCRPGRRENVLVRFLWRRPPLSVDGERR